MEIGRKSQIDHLNFEVGSRKSEVGTQISSQTSDVGSRKSLPNPGFHYKMRACGLKF